MAILDKDPTETLHVKDMFDITWKGHDMGAARAHSFYLQDLKQVITKFGCLTKIDSKSIALFITPQFERPNFMVVVEQAVVDGKAKSSWDVNIWETDEGFKRRVRLQNFIVHCGDGPARQYPLYTISIRPKHEHSRI